MERRAVILLTPSLTMNQESIRMTDQTEQMDAPLDLDAIRAEARAEVMAQSLDYAPEAEKAEVKEQKDAELPAESEDDVDPELEGKELDGDDDGSYTPEDEINAEAEKPKRKKSWGERERDKRIELEQRYESERNQLMEQNRKLQDLLRSALPTVKQDQEQKTEWLDEDAQKETLTLVDSVRKEFHDQLFVQHLRAENTPERAQVVDKVLADEAERIMIIEGLSREEAVKVAAAVQMNIWNRVYSRGMSVGQYIDTIGAKYAKPQPQVKAAKSRIDMKEVSKLRSEAGAPTNKSIAGDAAVMGSLDAIRRQARKEVMEETSFL